MPKYQTGAIDEISFLDFVNSPSSKLLTKFVRALSSNKHANLFFRKKPPVWAKDAKGWVKAHLLKDDWYRELTEPEAVAWHSAVDGIATQFECGERVGSTEHGEIHFDLFELAAELFQGDAANRQMLRMSPFRCYGLSAAIESIEPCDRVYWPEHAMLDTQQLVALGQDARDFLARLPRFEISSADVFDTVEERRSAAEFEAKELLSYVDRLIEANAMWFARIDC